MQFDGKTPSLYRKFEVFGHVLGALDGYQIQYLAGILISGQATRLDIRPINTLYHKYFQEFDLRKMFDQGLT